MKGTSVPGDLIGTGAVAARCGVDPRTVVRWCLVGRLPSYKLGGRWKVSVADLELFLSRARYDPGASPSGAIPVRGYR